MSTIAAAAAATACGVSGPDFDVRRVEVHAAKRDGFALGGSRLSRSSTRAPPTAAASAISVMGHAAQSAGRASGNIAERSGHAGFNIMGAGHDVCRLRGSVRRAQGRRACCRRRSSIVRGCRATRQRRRRHRRAWAIGWHMPTIEAVRQRRRRRDRARHRPGRRGRQPRRRQSRRHARPSARSPVRHRRRALRAVIRAARPGAYDQSRRTPLRAVPRRRAAARRGGDRAAAGAARRRGRCAPTEHPHLEKT